MTTLNFTLEQENYLTQTAKSLGMSLENFILMMVNYKATPKADSKEKNTLANRLVLMDDLTAPVDDNVWEVD